MHASTQQLLTYLEQNRATLRAAVDHVPVSQRQLRPAPDRWSTAEVLEHLAIVEKRITGRLADAVTAARTNAAATTDDVAPFDEHFARRLLNRELRVTASQASEPTGTLDVDAAWSELEAGRTSLIDLVHQSDGLPLADPLAPHPVFGRLTFRQWIVFLGGHDARHADQIREIAGALNA
jgi:uncharacterized damage-inducible protein DinB